MDKHGEGKATTIEIQCILADLLYDVAITMIDHVPRCNSAGVCVDVATMDPDV
jgi:hypothetical protein